MITLVLIDFAAVVLAVETAVLLLWRPHVLLPSRVAAMSGAGLALLIALHAQAAGFPLLVTAAALGCAGISHAFDLAQRVRDRRRV